MLSELPREILKKYWGYDTFRSPQEEIIQNTLNNYDTLAILPTGGGKSICFQVPALCKEGVCLVISPLISLMEDQVQNLKSKGVKALALTGSIPYYELDRLLGNAIVGVYKFVYISPERLQNYAVQEAIKQMKINLIAIDEAHCISHWGQDFRPAYLTCGNLRELLPQVPIIALTASATNKVQDDIINSLKLKNVKISKKSLERKNISYIKYPTADKIGTLVRILKKYNKSSIIYVKTRGATKEISSIINGFGISSTYYHGGMSLEEKNKHMNLWLLNDCPVMVATNAFGMGVDKPDVQTVIHWDLPSSLEDYFQEAGRAGRNGASAFAILLYNNLDIEKLKNDTQKSLINTKFLKEIYKKLNAFFFIPYGEGINERFNFSFSRFTQRFQLEKISTQAALEVLEKNGIIEFEKTSHKTVNIKIINTQEEFLRNLITTTEKESSLALFIIKNYPNIFQENVVIVADEISNTIKTSTNEITKIFEKWQNLGFIQLKTEETDAIITFLVTRDDERTINSIASKIRYFNEKKQTHYQNITDYINNNNKCLQQYLAAYFGEKLPHKCGCCSFCLKNAPNEEFKQKAAIIKKDILNLLAQKAYSLPDLCVLLPYYESNILKILKELMNENKININIQNEIILT